MKNETTLTDLAYRCLDLAEDLSDNGIVWCPEEDIALALEHLTEANLYATAEAIAASADWCN